jgi:tetratricopeptide (TPR) repeat protein
MRKSPAILLAMMVAAAPATGGVAFAAGSGGDGVPTCKTGLVYDKKTKKCVPRSGAVDDDSLYSTGRQLALGGNYDEAIAVLSLVKEKNDVRVLNYLGYAHRKAGRLRVGIGYYEEALRLDPDYTLVREYYGEAQLALGDVRAAEVQLAEIAARCGTGCEEYSALSSAIEAHGKS